MNILKRGIIISNTNGFRFKDEPHLLEPKLTKTDLMNYALYWDQILCSYGWALQPIAGDESFIKEGILQYTSPGTGFSGVPSPENFHKNSMAALIQCYEKNRFPNTPIDWTMHHRVNSPFFVNNDVIEKNIIRVRFNSLLPIPSRFVTADKILEFKEHNRQSLQNLHNHIFELYVRISNITDPDIRAIYEQQLFNEFEDALKEYQSAFKGKFKNPQFIPLTADINLKYLNQKAADIDLKNSLKEGVQVLFDQSISIEGALEIGKSILSVFSTKQNIPKVVSNKTAFHYIGEAIQRGIISQF